VLIARLPGADRQGRDTARRLDEYVTGMLLDYLAHRGLNPGPDADLSRTKRGTRAQPAAAAVSSSLVSVPELNRNPTVKDEDRATRGRRRSAALMLTYPVHQAADILFCKAKPGAGGAGPAAPPGDRPADRAPVQRAVRPSGVPGSRRAAVGRRRCCSATDGTKMSKSRGNTNPAVGYRGRDRPADPGGEDRFRALHQLRPRSGGPPSSSPGPAWPRCAWGRGPAPGPADDIGDGGGRGPEKRGHHRGPTTCSPRSGHAAAEYAAGPGLRAPGCCGTANERGERDRGRPPWPEVQAAIGQCAIEPRYRAQQLVGARPRPGWSRDPVGGRPRRSGPQSVNEPRSGKLGPRPPPTATRISPGFPPPGFPVLKGPRPVNAGSGRRAAGKVTRPCPGRARAGTRAKAGQPTGPGGRPGPPDRSGNRLDDPRRRPGPRCLRHRAGDHRPCRPCRFSGLVDDQVGVGEAGVGQAVAEGEQRRRVLPSCLGAERPARGPQVTKDG